mmetsp:Transcript_17789/g.26795  ORF Transcript_17789/g.26795 Transcript_17789/m.26795 type:complete len:220 (+) Transcript_17789:2732-3391(+)
MAISGNGSFEFNGQVVNWIVFEVVLIPQVVSSRVQVDSIDCNEFCVIPAKPLTPCSNPNSHVSLLGYILCQCLKDSSAIYRHTHNVTNKETNNDSIFCRLGTFRDFFNCSFEICHELAIRWSQGHNITPLLGTANDLSHLFGKPIVVVLLWIFRASPNIHRSLMNTSNDLSTRDVPHLVVIVVVMASQDLVYSFADMCQPHSIFVPQFGSRRFIHVALA